MSDRSDPPSPEEPASEEVLKARKAALEEKLRSHQPQEFRETRLQRDKSDRSNWALAFRLSSEFIAGIVVGAGIGYAIDEFFGTRPWAMIVFLMLGFAAAILNVLRVTGKVAESGSHLHKVRGSDSAKSMDGPEGNGQ